MYVIVLHPLDVLRIAIVNQDLQDPEDKMFRDDEDRVGGLEVIGITDLVFRILEILDDDGDRRTSRGCKTITYITKIIALCITCNARA